VRVHVIADMEGVAGIVKWEQTTGGESLPMMEWSESPLLAEQFMQIAKTLGLVVADGHVHKRSIRGKKKNEDVFV